MQSCRTGEMLDKLLQELVPNTMETMCGALWQLVGIQIGENEDLNDYFSRIFRLVDLINGKKRQVSSRSWRKGQDEAGFFFVFL